jgi:F-type H+-transporting ATPase subunit delta
MIRQAENYAKALFELKISEEVMKHAKEILTSSRELSNALNNPEVKKVEKHKVIDTIFAREISGFLKVLCDHGSFAMIGQIFDAFEALVLKDKKYIKAVLRYVTKPEEDQQERIRTLLRNKYQAKEVLLELMEDPSLIGGFILTVGNTVYDKSIRGALASLYASLVKR